MSVHSESETNDSGVELMDQAAFLIPPNCISPTDWKIPIESLKRLKRIRCHPVSMALKIIEDTFSQIQGECITKNVSVSADVLVPILAFCVYRAGLHRSVKSLVPIANTCCGVGKQAFICTSLIAACHKAKEIDLLHTAKTRPREIVALLLAYSAGNDLQKHDMEPLMVPPPTAWLHEEAVDRYSVALRFTDEPSVRAKILLARARIQFQAGRIASAHSDAKDSLEIKPNSPAALDFHHQLVLEKDRRLREKFMPSAPTEQPEQSYYGLDSFGLDSFGLGKGDLGEKIAVAFAGMGLGVGAAVAAPVVAAPAVAAPAITGMSLGMAANPASALFVTKASFNGYVSLVSASGISTAATTAVLTSTNTVNALSAATAAMSTTAGSTTSGLVASSVGVPILGAGVIGVCIWGGIKAAESTTTMASDRENLDANAGIHADADINMLSTSTDADAGSGSGGSGTVASAVHVTP